MTRDGLRQIRVERQDGEPAVDDQVAVEEPLELVLDGTSFVVTMRTPGHDVELAAGLLLTEGVVERPDELTAIEPCRDPLAYDPDNRLDVTLSAEARQRFDATERERRRQWATAACGLCGKARIEEIYGRWPTISPRAVDAATIRRLPALMRPRQALFDRTGGLHAAALFTLDGELLAVREDIGRHNAVDKLIGRSLLRDELPWTDRIVLVSARAGFEIVQKVMMAQAPILAAVGAASSLATEAARRGGLDLWSFVQATRSNHHVG
ncbi:MAG: formate dehydrogenase accessory sulfurtransferase FdhD [Acidobacteriota bacterium]